MYQYETHLHTLPVSKCAKSTVEEQLSFYRELGYDGVFITNHFIDGNLNMDKKTEPYEKLIEFYFSDYENAASLAPKIGIKVFPGVEISYHGTDFLLYGLGKEWFLQHPEYRDLTIKEKLGLVREAGALVIQAHPFRTATYISHIRLFPENVEGVEVINACRPDPINEMAKIYAETFELLPFAGSDNHKSPRQKLAGIQTETPIENVEDFIRRIREGKYELFSRLLPNPE